MRSTAGVVCALAAALALAGTADAAELVTWTTTSEHVDPAKVRFNDPPPGVPPRPNALRVNVLLPDGYDGKQAFPVLYLLHGHGDTYDAWANAERGDVMDVAKGFPGIIVMPEGARGWYVNWWNGGRRGEPGWERYHLDELIPVVERRLRIRPGRRWRAIAGLSMGGEGTMFYASQRPGYFGSAASFSGAISIQRPEWPAGFDTQGERHVDVFGDPEDQRFYWTGHNPTALTDSLRHTRLYVTVGDGTPGSPGEADNAFGALAEADLKQHAEDFVAAARRSDAPVTYRPRQGIHDWPYWREHLADAIKWDFFAPVAERPDAWTYETVAQSGEAWDLRFRFATPPESLETFRRDGRRLRATGSGAVTIETADGCGLTAPVPFDLTLPEDEQAPVSLIGVRTARLRRGVLTVRGTVSDRGCDGSRVDRVLVAIARREGGGRCRHLGRGGRLGAPRSCRRPAYLLAAGTSRWRLRRRVALPRGAYTVRSRAVDRAGNVERKRRQGRRRRNFLTLFVP
jgi:S-formylglutathione hydrolase FrmB